ncbi:OB-fold nucleic acid binding domain-containing protein [Patescibacteria group bacterium]|nr:OB-fold nucleic acid binding domain-containing protein [Patescibacteria group bacterium]MCL5733435.1 OB-fold nucleic acid binding domain-containing protein [Patescibacteria group bacterium]
MPDKDFQNINSLEEDRLSELNEIKSVGIDPYPDKSEKDFDIVEARKDFNKLSKSGKKFWLAGRIMSFRDQGSLIFSDLKDESGKIQLVFKKNTLKNFSFFKKVISRGDFVSAKGILFKTKKGEISLEVASLKILAKSIKPLPSEWYGISDTEERFRKRYLDLIFNEESKARLIRRSQIIREIREKLWAEDFLEVETPVLQPLPGGALARPFETHHNALNQDFYLRIAPELYLKRLLVGGLEKIFEIGKVFRNEGIDREHNPEFTILELYWAYQNNEGLMKFTEKLLKPYFPGKWQKITFSESIKKYTGADFGKINIEEADDIFKREVRPKLENPTWVIDYPKAISPLAKSYADKPEWTERFQLVIKGMEVVNAFSELNDPLEQEKRMKEQEEKYRAGDKEASRLDEEFIEALKYGMPPAAGLGIGIDRLVALATNSDSVKEIIAFPTLKNKN